MSKFITIEAPDFTGKTTLINGLKKELENYIFYKEPFKNYSTELNTLSELIYNKDTNKDNSFLYWLAQRNITWNDYILPLLNNNSNIICDRFYDSTMIYQGILQNNFTKVKQIHDLFIPNLKIDLTFYLKIDWESIKLRLEQRKINNDLDTLDNVNESYIKTLITSYDYYFDNLRDRNVIVIDATQEKDLVLKNVIKHLKTN